MSAKTLAATTVRTDQVSSPVATPIDSRLPLVQSTNCCTTSTSRAVRNDIDWEDMHHMILQLDLPMSDKNLVLVRFRRIFGHIDGHYRTVQRYYNNSRMFVITASIINPALLSIASSNTGDTVHTVLFWIVLSLQMLVSLVTAYIAFFKWDKKYFVYMVHKQRVEQEIWTFLELTGKYGAVDPSCNDEVAVMKTSHRTKIKLLLHHLETIYRKLQDADASIQNTENENDAPQVMSSSSSFLPTKRNPSFVRNVQHHQKQRMDATERKLEDIAFQLNTTNDPHMQTTLTRELERYKQVRQQNRAVSEQVDELEKRSMSAIDSTN